MVGEADPILGAITAERHDGDGVSTHVVQRSEAEFLRHKKISASSVGITIPSDIDYMTYFGELA